MANAYESIMGAPWPWQRSAQAHRKGGKVNGGEAPAM